MFISGALIMCFNLWKTVTSVGAAQTDAAAIPAE